MLKQSLAKSHGSLWSPSRQAAAKRAGAVETPGSPFLEIPPLGRAFVLLIYLGYFLLVLGVALRNRTPGYEWVIPALACYLIVRIAPVIFYQPSYGWFHPLVFGAIIALLDLSRAFPSYAWGIEWHRALTEYSPERLSKLVAYDLALSTAGLLAYYLGYFAITNPKIPRLSFAVPQQISWKMLAIVGFAVAVFLVYMQGKGGIGAHVLSWGQTREVALAGDYYWVLLISIGSCACLIWLGIEPRAMLTPIFWGCALVSLGMIFLTNGSRSAIIYNALMALMIWSLRTRKLPIVKLVVTGFIALVLLSVLGELRRSTWRGEVDWTTVTEMRPLEAATNMLTGELVERRSSGNGTLPILAYVPHKVDMLYGDSYLAAVTLVVPRSVWPAKPGLISGRVGETFFALKAGVPPGAVGEAYWNFHIPGVLAVFLVFGCFHRWLARTFASYPTAVTVVPYAILLFRANPSGPSFVDTLLAVIPTLVILWLIGAIVPSGRRFQEGKKPYDTAA
jgi:hypothetical protein